MALVENRRRVGLRGLALAALTAALGYALEGLLVAAAIVAVVAVVWSLSTAVYAFGAGELLVVVLATGADVAGAGPGPEFLAVQAALGGVLAAPVFDRWPPRSAAVIAASFVVAAVALAVVYRVEPTWRGVAALAVAYGITAYGLHRYELVRLDLVAGADR